MFSFYFLIITLLCSPLLLQGTQGHFHDDHHHHHQENYIYSDDHDEYVHDHHDHHHHHRTLRESASLFVIGNRRYANQNAFIHSGNRCGARQPTRTEMINSTRIVAKYMASIHSRRDQSFTTIEVPTYFHVITNGSDDSNIDDTALQAQLNVLNDAFRIHGFTFRLIQTTRTENSAWYNAGISSIEQDEMKSTLRVGDASTLNVYFSGSGGALGYATFPSDYRNFPSDDGVVVLGPSVPGGSITNYNDGKTLVHEVGHWFGLYHTFQTSDGLFPLFGFFLRLFGLRTGCNTEGDEVDDTPAQRTETGGCPASKDTCPSSPGSDPINNYMDYSYDICLIEFTPGQRDRMMAMWNEYRA